MILMADFLDSPKSLILHRQIIRRNGFLNKLYVDFYTQIKSLCKNDLPIVELGSGAGFIKQVIPSAITSDVVKGFGIDMVFSASKIPFDTGSVGAFIMLNVFHHLNNPYKALTEMERCLKAGGKIIMIEPYNTLWGKFVYQNFHHEEFNPGAKWKLLKKGRLSSANGALPWIIFNRDYLVFKKKFPGFQIIKIFAHTPFRYIISGGLSHRQLGPDFSYPLCKLIENVCSPLNNWIGMFATIEIRKTL